VFLNKKSQIFDTPPVRMHPQWDAGIGGHHCILPGDASRMGCGFYRI